MRSGKSVNPARGGRLTSKDLISLFGKTLYENNRVDTIEVISDGLSNQKGTKVDFRLFVDGKSFEGVSLKANSKRIGQVARSQSKIDNGEFQVDLAHFLNGLFKIDLSSEIKQGPKDRFEMRDYLKKIFAKVANHINKNSSS